MSSLLRERMYFKKHPCQRSHGRISRLKRKLGSIWRRQWHPTPVLLPGKSHGQRSLVGCCLWGLIESDTTERLHFHFSLSCIGEGNGNPLQCSCLENPREGGAWWAAVYGVALSRTRLKHLSSSSRALFWDMDSLGQAFALDIFSKKDGLLYDYDSFGITQEEKGKLFYSSLFQTSF